jgi:hypothetical protein
VDGDPSADVTILGELERIKQVFIGGVAQPTDPITPVRSDPPGWRVSHYGDRILNYDFVQSRRK